MNENLLFFAKKTVEIARDLVPYSTNLYVDFTTNEQNLLLVLVRRKHPLRKVGHLISPLYKNDKEIIPPWVEIPNVGFFPATLTRDIKKMPLQRVHKNNFPRTTLEALENRVKNSIRFKVGNCEELSSICCILLMEYNANKLGNLNKSIVKFGMPYPFDHSFVVLGMAENADARNPNTWGAEAIVLDPWLSLTYHVESQLELPVSQQEPMFRKTCAALHTNKIVLRRLKVGQGHSERWITKQRQNIAPLSFLETNIEDFEAEANSSFQSSF